MCDCPECKEYQYNQYVQKINKSAKTQKAKGILNGLWRLKKLSSGKRYRSICPLFEVTQIAEHKLITNKNHLYNLDAYNLPLFARPCPKRPRHGFVDSRAVHNKKSLFKIWKEVKEADPQGEMVLGPYFGNVSHSAVYVDSGNLSVGFGNDGATGGKNSVSFPVSPTALPATFRSMSGIKKDEAVYLESIRDGNQYGLGWYLVQARGGPSISAANPDFIPDDVVVKRVVKPIDDLLKWEQEVQTFKPGTVVYAKGHTLASHAAIHCIINQVPFVTTFEPKVGNKIKANQTKKVSIFRDDFKRGVKVGAKVCMNKKTKDMRSLMFFALSILHNWAYIKQSESAGWLLGAASIIFSKICAALAHGEHRHFYDSALKHMGRSEVYKSVLSGGNSYFKRLPRLFEDFYSGNWESGFGGIPWANCAWYSLVLWQEITKMNNKTSKRITDREISKLVGIINKTTNVAHNNGWWFNKFAGSDDLDFLAKYPGLAAFTSADIFMECYKKSKMIKKLENLTQYKKITPPFTTAIDGKPRWVLIDGLLSESILDLECKGEKDCDTISKTVKISKNEYSKVVTLFKNKNKDKWDSVVIPVNSKGNFKLPGAKKTLNLRKVFGIKDGV